MKPEEKIPRRAEVEDLLARCVQCGFCNATCPTYLATGLELEGPRGRIGLIKSMVEGHPVSEKTQHHLDRCLTCLNCETSCPSGVEYRRIIDIGRAWMKDCIPRGIGLSVLSPFSAAIKSRSIARYRDLEDSSIA